MSHCRLSSVAGAALPAVCHEACHEDHCSEEVAIIAPEADKFKALGNLELVVYTGQFTRDETSGIDMLMVGDVNQRAVQKFITELEAQEGKELRYAVMTPTEFNYRRQIKDRFITTVMGAKKQVLLDVQNLAQS